MVQLIGNDAASPAEQAFGLIRVTATGQPSAFQPGDTSFVFTARMNDGETKEFFRIYSDGRVVIGEGFDTDQAARVFWDRVDELRPGMLQRPTITAVGVDTNVELVIDAPNSTTGGQGFGETPPRSYFAEHFAPCPECFGTSPVGPCGTCGRAERLP